MPVTDERVFEHVPAPPSERGHWFLAAAIAAIGAAVLAAVLTGLVGRSQPAPAAAPPPVLVAAVTPAPGSGSGHVPAAEGLPGATAGAGGGAMAGTAAGNGARAHARGHHAIVGEQQHETLAGQRDPLQVHVQTRWLEGFYPIYSVAQTTFGVNWLLIASIHDQESAFSTAPSTYKGLNYAGCCGGPMQFNVMNGRAGAGKVGIPSTWDLVSGSYVYGRRPTSYDHMTAKHPSIYDDFDAIMAAAHLLSADGATLQLNEGAWDAAYDYYGHDSDGVAYADQVLARAIGWSQHGFCADCGLDEALVSAVYAAYGAPVLAALEAEQAAAARARAAARSRSATRPKP
ncbi:MAG TPA: hypothetical protein VMG80_05720 [Solirubrobacteraceae bacterium]|nr:hypothetical protein [Solirubrobacteraceae bacterium]